MEAPPLPHCHWVGLPSGLWQPWSEVRQGARDGSGEGNRARECFHTALELFLRLGFVSRTGQKERWSSSWDSWKLDKLGWSFVSCVERGITIPTNTKDHAISQRHFFFFCLKKPSFPLKSAWDIYELICCDFVTLISEDPVGLTPRHHCLSWGTLWFSVNFLSFLNA